MQAQLERLSWLGLSAEDFDHITSYDNSRYCKPNPEYYREICRVIGVHPEDCLMIGNDESDDMKGASLAGMECFLVTDHRIMSEHFMWTGERGSFEQALRMIERMRF
jgi:FMN phosphatase YigB (HAD superfamily)